MPKKLSAPGRQARLERQRQELRGLDIQGPLEPPQHALYDLCASMIEKNEVSYISPSKCLSRQQELMETKPEKEIQLTLAVPGVAAKDTGLGPHWIGEL